MKKKSPVAIVATLGPSSSNKKTIAQLAQTGVSVFRVNMSHLDRAGALHLIKTIRTATASLKKPIRILGDLQGPKIRTGEIARGIVLKTGAQVFISKKPVTGSAKTFSVSFPALLDSLVSGRDIYLGDGDCMLRVVKRTSTGIFATVVAGGPIRSRMGFTAQGIALPDFVFTEKDHNDLQTLLDAHVDMIAVSFIQTHRDIETIKQLIATKGSKRRPSIIAKIETASALHHIRDIIRAADGVMVARGDLGFSIPFAELPHAQKHIIATANRERKLVITATHMLESMTKSIVPTRAEICDIANAVFDGTDAVMLSGETASGLYPLEATRIMREVADGCYKK